MRMMVDDERTDIENAVDRTEAAVIEEATAIARLRREVALIIEALEKLDLAKFQGLENHPQGEAARLPGTDTAKLLTPVFTWGTGVFRGRADDGIRTRDLRFTKPLLYQLSYVGLARAKITSRGAGHKHLYNGRTKVSPISRRAMRSGVCLSAAPNLSIGSRNGSKLSRKV
jgi:hypothetical protein